MGNSTSKRRGLLVAGCARRELKSVRHELAKLAHLFVHLSCKADLFVRLSCTDPLLGPSKDYLQVPCIRGGAYP